MIINGGDVIYLYSCKARSSEMVREDEGDDFIKNLKESIKHMQVC